MHIKRSVASASNEFVAVTYEEWLEEAKTFNMKNWKLYSANRPPYEPQKHQEFYGTTSLINNSKYNSSA